MNATNMKSVKAFVNDDGVTALACPVCGLVRPTSVSKFRNKRHVLSVKCKCSENFKVHLEFRKHFRKSTDIDGLYSLLAPAAGGGRVKIQNISRSGVGFSISGKHTIQIGNLAKLNFTLDNRNATELDKQVTIKSISENYIGCEFIENQAFEKELGFYLRP